MDKTETREVPEQTPEQKAVRWNLCRALAFAHHMLCCLEAHFALCAAPPNQPICCAAAVPSCSFVCCSARLRLSSCHTGMEAVLRCYSVCAALCVLPVCVCLCVCAACTCRRMC